MYIPSRKKILSLNSIVQITARLRKQGKRVVTTNGCFDILHVGHVRNLEFSKSLGDVLVVGVNSDASVRHNKGKDRPLVPERERAEMIGALASVDYVFIFSDKTPDAWLRKVRPDIHTKGQDRTLREIVERETLKKLGTKLVLVPYMKGKSTTNLIARARLA